MPNYHWWSSSFGCRDIVFLSLFILLLWTFNSFLSGWLLILMIMLLCLVFMLLLSRRILEWSSSLFLQRWSLWCLFWRFFIGIWWWLFPPEMSIVIDFLFHLRWSFIWFWCISSEKFLASSSSTLCHSCFWWLRKYICFLFIIFTLADRRANDNYWSCQVHICWRSCCILLFRDLNIFIIVKFFILDFDVSLDVLLHLTVDRLVSVD